MPHSLAMEDLGFGIRDSGFDATFAGWTNPESQIPTRDVDILTAMRNLAALVIVLLSAFDAGAQTQRITLRAASAFDGKGRSIPDVTIVVADGKIADVRSGKR